MRDQIVVGLQAVAGKEREATEVVTALGVASKEAWQSFWQIPVMAMDHAEARERTITQLDRVAPNWRDSLIVMELPPS